MIIEHVVRLQPLPELVNELLNYPSLEKRGFSPGDKSTHVRGASKIKLKNVNKKRMATAWRQIFFGISQGIHC